MADSRISDLGRSLTAPATTDHVAVDDGDAAGAGKTTIAQLLAAGGALLNVVEDTTPQLGGNLDANGNTITGLDASATASGIVELATIAETDTGTDATRAVTPAGLAGSALQTKVDGIETAADVTDATNVAAAGAVMDSDISEGEGFVRKTGAGAYEAVKTNLGASTAPGATDDSAAGYAVGSRWIDTTADKEYVCLDSTATAAVWTETTGAGGGGISNVVEDTTPQLGGNLDANGNTITGLDASTTAKGIVELATTAEADTGTSTTLAVTPDALADSKWSQHAIIVAISDETTALTTGTAKATIRMPYAFTLEEVRASLTTASTSGIPTFDINESGTTILSTKLTIDANEKTSETAATAAVISDSALADDAEITFDIDVAGTAAAGAKIYLIGRRA